MGEAIYPVPEAAADAALINEAAYRDMYRRSVEAPEDFWREQAARIDWIRPFTKVKQSSFDEADFEIAWYADGTLNLCANALDRHLAGVERQARNRARQPRLGRHVYEEVVDRGCADGGEHAAAVGVGEREIAHSGVSLGGRV